jgi:hypothetical protein
MAIEIAMWRQFVRAAAFIVLFAGAARAQVVPGDSPDRGVGAAVSGSRGLGAISRTRMPKGSWSEYENERNYRETVKRIPDKKSSNDPWKNVRQAPAVSVADRHQPQ